MLFGFRRENISLPHGEIVYHIQDPKGRELTSSP